MMLRSQKQQTSSKASSKTSLQISPTMRASIIVKNILVTELANTLLPLLSQSIQEGVAANINEEFKKVNDCITANHSKIKEKLSVIGATNERIEVEFAEFANLVLIRRTNHDATIQKLTNLEKALLKYSEEVAVAQLSINSLLKENKVVENKLDNLKKICVTQENFEERVVETVSQTMQ